MFTTSTTATHRIDHKIQPEIDERACVRGWMMFFFLHIGRKIATVWGDDSRVAPDGFCRKPPLALSKNILMVWILEAHPHSMEKPFMRLQRWRVCQWRTPYSIRFPLVSRMQPASYSYCCWVML